jgi:hypothetical protein
MEKEKYTESTVKTKLLFLLLILMVSVSCQSQSSKNNSSLSGLDKIDFLQTLKDKNLDGKELIKTIKEVNKYGQVSKSDAEIMVSIYSNHKKEFLIASNISNQSEELFTADDVSKFLGLILKHRELIDDVRQITRQIASENDEKIAKNLIVIYIAAKTNALETLNNSEQTDIAPQDTVNRLKRTNTMALVQTFELSAYKRVSGQETATPEQLERSKKFLSALKIYNNQLKEDEKILNKEGRLTNPFDMNEKQIRKLENIFQDDANILGQRELQEVMKETWQTLQDSTKKQIQ